jgi:hypothetical protein
MSDTNERADERPYFVGAAYGPKDAEVHRRIMEDLRKMTPEEIFQTSVRSGIYSPDGRLLPPYADDEGDAVDEGSEPPARVTR